MRLLALMLCVVLCGCAPKVEFRSAINDVDPRLQPYVHAWQLNYEGGWPSGLKMQFGVPSENDHDKLVALCNKVSGNGGGQHTIYIREDKWDKHKVYQREATVMHELGHCVKLIDHLEEYTTHTVTIDNKEKEIDCPVSWMTENIMDEATYAACRDFLYQDMFGIGEEDVIYPNYKAGM
jgi:hypothetical protein